MARPPARHHANAARRRGTAYVFVLLTAVILSVIGLTALAAARVQTHVQSDSERVLQARYLAASVVEVALQRIDNDANWRTTYTNDTWTPEESYKGAKFRFKLVDETDGDLANDSSQSARLHVSAGVGVALRLYSVGLAAPNANNFIVNSGMESGALGWLTWPSGQCQLDPQNGSGGPHGGALYIRVKDRSSADSGIAQDVTFRMTSGATYQASVWLRMKDNAETARVTITANATGGTTEASFTQSSVGTSWTLVRGSLTPSWSGTLNTAYLRVSTASSDQEFCIDDANLFTGSQPLPRMTMTAGTWRQQTLP